ncbi:MAG: hypothetical protein AB7E52_08450 [Bdellovibrionales bacterium]
MTLLSKEYEALSPEEIVELSPRELFRIVGAEIGGRWEALADHAETFMAARQNHSTKKTLILVCAQHPLKNGVEPGDEFTLRLQTAMDTAEKIKREGGDPIIYVPGSLHQPDLINLSAAGATWLKQQGCTAHICSDDVNEFYKGAYSPAPHKGVYGCSDEAYVATQILEDDPEIGSLILVATHNQALRVTLHLIANGVTPTQTIAVKPEKAYHTPENETKVNIPSVLMAKDPTFQSPDEPLPVFLRKLRIPGFPCTP